MKSIKGQYHYQVKDFEELKDYPQDSIVFAIFTDEGGKLQERPIYKTVETAISNEVYLYLGDNRRGQNNEGKTNNYGRWQYFRDMFSWFNKRDKKQKQQPKCDRLFYKQFDK